MFGRWVEPLRKKKFAAPHAHLVFGARQTGKSTLLRKLLDQHREEMVNWGADRTTNRDLILTMSAKLEALIKAEIGVDDGRELPNIPLVNWSIDRVS